MKRKVGKETERGSKKRKEVGNDNSLAAFMFAKQQAVSVLKKARDTKNAQLRKGKEMGLDEAAHWQAEPVQVRKGHTHDIEGTETVHEHRELR